MTVLQASNKPCAPPSIRQDKQKNTGLRKSGLVPISETVIKAHPLVSGQHVLKPGVGSSGTPRDQNQRGVYKSGVDIRMDTRVQETEVPLRLMAFGVPCFSDMSTRSPSAL